MDIKNQISGCNNPQEFTRLCNVLLQAEFGDAYQVIDDDRSDGGNDGYIRSEKKLFARHCFKKIPKRSLDSAILEKAKSDLSKISDLRKKGLEINKWTFLTNYPISNPVFIKLREFEGEYRLEINHLGSEYLANLVLKYPYLSADFSWIEVYTISRDIKGIYDLLLNKTKEKEGKLSEKISKDLIEATKLSDKPSQENKIKLKSLFYSSVDLAVQLQCSMSLLNTFDVLEDSVDDLIHYCDVGISAARNLKKIGEEAVLLAEKGRWISYNFAKLDMETAFQIRMGNTVGYNIITEEDRDRVLTRLGELEKEYLALFNDAVKKARSSKRADFLAMVFLAIGNAAGNRFIHFNALGAEQRAKGEKKLCKIAINDAKNLYSSAGDELGYAYVLHNLANSLRLFGEKDAAAGLCEKVINTAKNYKDLRLLEVSTDLLERIKSDKIPDYVNGETD